MSSTRRADEMTHARRVGVWAITEGRLGRIVGKIITNKADTGGVTVALWDWSNPESTREVQQGHAGGAGYDKMAAAIFGMAFGHPDGLANSAPDGFRLSESWEKDLCEHGFNAFRLL